MPWHEGRLACCHGIEWRPVDALLSFACLLRVTGSPTCSVRGILCFLRSSVSNACRYAHPTHAPTHPCLASRRVGRTALMTMAFAYVGDRCVIVSFTAPRARVGGERGHSVWSDRRHAHVETHLILELIPPPSLLLLGNPHHAPPRLAHVPQEGHRFDPTLNKQAPTKVSALALLCLAPCCVRCGELEW